MKNNITIFGAKGKVGIEILKYFAKNNISCNAITRDIKNIVSFPGVTWLQGDLSDYQNIPELIAGTESLFLNTDFAAQMAEIKINLIREAQRASVKHIVYLSYGLIPDEMIQQSNSPVHQQHIQVEQALIDSGIAYTIIRPSGFMQSWLLERAPLIREERKIKDITGEGKLPYIDTRDIAEVIARALYTEPEKHRNKIYELTGGQALNFYQIAATISEVIGSTVTFINETTEEARESMAKKGYPEWAIDLLLYFADCQKKGMVETVTPALPAIVGRPAGDLATFVRDYIDYFK